MTFNTKKPAELLLLALREPAVFPSFATEQKQIVLRLARRLDLLGVLHAGLEQADVLAKLSVRVQDFLEGGWMIAKEHERSTRWEVNRIQRAFFGTGLPVILLKGAAYVMLELPLAKGRLLADVDILLPETDLPLAEKCLQEHGWFTAIQDPYDQYYYREWMHELPPMIHRNRQTELDVHHAILPKSARLHPDPARLLAAALPVPGLTGIWTLAPMDMILHATTQLFYDNDFQKGGLRELLDLDALLRHYGHGVDFWEPLMNRAKELELLKPLYYGLYFSNQLCQTPIPPFILATSRQGIPNRFTLGCMSLLLPWAIFPQHPDQPDNSLTMNMARWLLYVRSHWLRMPLSLLIPHLTRKWVKKWHFNVWNRRSI